MTSTIEREIRTTQIYKKLLIGEFISFAVGFAIFSGVELSYRYLLPNADVWNARAWFFPVAGVISIVAMFSSVSMQGSLRARGVPHPLKKRKEGIRLLLETNDEEGLRLMRSIAMAANAHLLAFGIAIALCVFATASL